MYSIVHGISCSSAIRLTVVVPDRFLRGQTKNESSAKDHMLAIPPPAFEPSRRVINSDVDTGVKLTLFQFQTCPFCCKVRAVLDYYGFNYDVIEVNSVMRQQVTVI